jgi:hypothetical protein
MASVPKNCLKILFIISCLTGYALEATLARASSSNLPPVAPEAYRYTSAPGGRMEDPAKETIFLTYDNAPGRVRCSSRTLGHNFSQVVAITLTPEGGVDSATLERTLSPTGELTQQSRIRKENGTVEVEVTTGQKSNIQNIRIPEGQELAVDVSLLYLMRRFPFETGGEWRVFMVDFSGQSVSVSLRSQGPELVTVPAGTFPCYRLEVGIGIAFLRATITYWLTKSPPHFLVKHHGKKGPFTKSYTTVLETMGSPALRSVDLSN